MFQTDKLVATQAKAIESAQALAQLAIDNAKVVAEIHYGATKDAVATAQSKASEILVFKDPKEVLEMFKTEVTPVVIAEVTAVQSKVSKVIRKTNKEAIVMLDSAISESKADLKKMVEEVTAKAPAGSESFVTTFEYLIDASLKSFDQAYAASKDVYSAFEKNVDGVMHSFQGQFAAESKPVTKARKTITA
jgi:tRNA G10  N-methylase Trm11